MREGYLRLSQRVEVAFGDAPNLGYVNCANAKAKPFLGVVRTVRYYRVQTRHDLMNTDAYVPLLIDTCNMGGNRYGLLLMPLDLLGQACPSATDRRRSRMICYETDVHRILVARVGPWLVIHFVPWLVHFAPWASCNKRCKVLLYQDPKRRRKPNRIRSIRDWVSSNYACFSSEPQLTLEI